MATVTEKPKPHDLSTYTAGPSSPPPTPATTAPTRSRPEDIDFDGNLRTSPELDAYYRSLASSRTPEQKGSAMATAIDRAKAAKEVQSKLDRVRDRFSGPYKVEGQTTTIRAQPMFRMNGGANMDKVAKHKKELERICARAGANYASAAGGYGGPENLVKVTQALIDTGKLPAGPGSVTDRIRSMQWEWGIGVDCAAYTQHALQAVNKKDNFSLGIDVPGTESFTGLGRNTHFSRVAVKDVRPGDVITLKSLVEAGHNVIVHGHTIADAERKAALAAQLPPGANQMLAMPGPLHVIEVDSSWGAGATGQPCGGYRRDVWLYDETNKVWGYVDQHVTPSKFRTSSVGPAGDLYDGAFRPK
jgi:hypothetical protein